MTTKAKTIFLIQKQALKENKSTEKQ